MTIYKFLQCGKKHMAHDEILRLIEDRIKNELARKRISPQYKTQLELQQLFILFLQEDHPKVMTMWAVFRPMAWAMGIFATALIGLLASGKIQIVIR